MGVHKTAFAKVNLYLHVTGRLENGYHLLDSLMVFARTGDALFFEENDQLSLEISGPFAPDIEQGPDNLVLKAARGLQKIHGSQKGARIRLEKNLPVAAGIGGGSADAAATLQGLTELWQMTPEQTELDKLALSLGADVPICLLGRAAHVSGIGEEITPLNDMADFAMVLVNPLVPLSTPAVFKGRTGAFSQASPLGRLLAFQELVQALKPRRNDLMPAAIQLVPEIKTVLSALEKTQNCALARMSGSGATCFGLYESLNDAKAAAQEIETACPRWWVRAAQAHV